MGDLIDSRFLRCNLDLGEILAGRERELIFLAGRGVEREGSLVAVLNNGGR